MCIFPAGCSMCPAVAWPQVHQHLAVTPLFSTWHTPWPNNRETWCTDLPYLAPFCCPLGRLCCSLGHLFCLGVCPYLGVKWCPNHCHIPGTPYLFTAGCWAFQVYLHAQAVGVVSPGHSVCLLAWRRSIINILQFPKISTATAWHQPFPPCTLLHTQATRPVNMTLSFKWNNPHGNEWF